MLQLTCITGTAWSVYAYMPRYHSHEKCTGIIIYMHMTGTKDEMEKLIKSRSDEDGNGEGDENEEQENEIGAESESNGQEKKEGDEKSNGEEKKEGDEKSDGQENEIRADGQSETQTKAKNRKGKTPQKKETASR